MKVVIETFKVIIYVSNKKNVKILKEIGYIFLKYDIFTKNRTTKFKSELKKTTIFVFFWAT